VSLALLGILPVSLTAQESAAAMLRNSGSGVYVNGNPVPVSIALFPHDMIETNKDGVARIEFAGSTVDIAPQTMVEFDSDQIVLDHGGVSVDTSRGLRVRVGCVTVVPVSDMVRTHYQVVDDNGNVTDSSLTSDTYLDAQSKNPKTLKQSERPRREIVREGEQKSREDKCGGGYKNGSPPHATGPWLNSPWAIPFWVIPPALTCWVLCFHDSNPVSPSKPNQ
jgi:hypothetical protein